MKTTTDIKTEWLAVQAQLDANPDAGETRDALLMQRAEVKSRALAMGHDCYTIYHW